jgi:hypothetical protein
MWLKMIDNITLWRYNVIKEVIGMSTIKRTQVYLYEEEYEALRQEAYKNHTSISSVLRGIVREHLLKKVKDKSVRNMTKIIALGSCGAKDVSIRHDEYLYGGLE